MASNVRQLRRLISGLSEGVATVAVALAMVFLLAVAAGPAAQAQTYRVIHNFTNGQDGGDPASVIIDGAGNLYGTASSGGFGHGTVYELLHKGSGWIFSPLYSFKGGIDGAGPSAAVVFGPDGLLYGTTYAGGVGDNGTVFDLKPSPGVCLSAICPGTETVVYRFGGSPDGASPGANLIFDQVGNIFGTTTRGGSAQCKCGTVFELTPSDSGWTETVLYSFGAGNNDGHSPWSGVVLDSAGNLYGATAYGGLYNDGTVFQLVPSDGGWKENILYNFQGGSDGSEPYSGVILDESGNLYGAAMVGGASGGGTIFKLAPSNGSWSFSLIYSVVGIPDTTCGPYAALTMDGAGNLYGTTLCDGAYGDGNVFKLAPSGNSWTYISLHDFAGGSDGLEPLGSVAFDASGNLYGTTSVGGLFRPGVVWEIAP